MSDFKRQKLACSGTNVHSNVADVVRHALGDGSHKLIKLARGPFGHKFYSTVSQVPDKARYVEVRGQLPDRVPEANALDMSAVQRVATLAWLTCHLESSQHALVGEAASRRLRADPPRLSSISPAADIIQY